MKELDKYHLFVINLQSETRGYVSIIITLVGWVEAAL